MHFKSKLFLLLFMVFPIISWSQGPCEFDVVLDSYFQCPSENGFYLPILNQPIGTYSGEFVTADGFFDANAAGSGPHYVIYTADPDVCLGSDTVDFFILQEGFLEIEGGSTSICAGDSTTLFAPNDLEYDWLGDGVRQNSFTFSPDSTTTYLVSGLDFTGCPNTIELTITVFQFGVDLQIAGPAYICYGDTATYEVPGVTELVWNDGSINPLFTMPMYQDTIFSAYIVQNAVCDTTIQLSVDVREPIFYDYEAVTEVCEGNPFQIFITGGNAAYYILGDIFFTDYAEFTFDYDTTLTLEIYNEFGCMKTRDIMFTVNEYPELEVDAPERLCEQDSVNIFVSGSSAIDWLDLSTGEPVSLTGLNQYQGIATDTINFQVFSLGITGCTAVQNIEIPVYPVPNVQVDSLTPFCINRIATAVGTGADFYLWNGLDIQNQITFPVEGDTTLILFGSTIYGCYAEDTLVVTAHPNPELYLTGEYTICELDTATLVATGAYYYFWDGEEGTDTLNAMPSADSLFTLIGKNIFGCADTATYFVDVNPAPQNVFSGQSEICVGESTLLEFSTDGLLFEWGDGSNQSTIVVNPADDTTYTVTSIGTNGCPRTSSFDVIVNDYPIMDVSGNAPVCFGDSLTLIATGADSFEWNNGLSGDTITYLPLVPGILRVEGSNGDCTTELVINITVNPTPSALFSFDADTLCTNGEGATWVASPAGGVFTGDGVVNNWFVLNAAEFGLNTVTYTYTNSFNCTSSATDSIVIETCINVEENAISFVDPYPNPFTNQIVLESAVENAQFQVLNSVGAIVYEGQLYKRAIIDTTEWSPGTYVIRLDQGVTPVTHRIVKIDG